MSRKPALFSIIGIVVACAFAVSCSSGGGGGTSKPATAKPGTPEYYWAAAGQTFKNGEFDKTITNLSKLDSNEKFAAKSQPWHMITAAGMAQGYGGLADIYTAGAKNKGVTAAFTRMASQATAGANNATIDFIEVMHGFLNNNKDAEIVLAFPAPSGSPAEPAEWGKIAKGIVPGEAEALSIQKTALRRGVLLTTSAGMGLKDDAAKALDAFKEGEVKLPRETFLRSLAQIAYDRAQLYAPKKMDQPKRLQIAYNEALDALKGIQNQTKADKDLAKKINDDLKKYRLNS